MMIGPRIGTIYQLEAISKLLPLTWAVARKGDGMAVVPMVAGVMTAAVTAAMTVAVTAAMTAAMTVAVTAAILTTVTAAVPTAVMAAVLIAAVVTTIHFSARHLVDVVIAALFAIVGVDAALRRRLGFETSYKRYITYPSFIYLFNLD